MMTEIVKILSAICIVGEENMYVLLYYYINCIENDTWEINKSYFCAVSSDNLHENSIKF